MKIYLEKEGKYRNAEGKTVGEILEKININPTTVLVVKNGALVSEKTSVKKTDKIRVIPVISGG